MRDSRRARERGNSSAGPNEMQRRHMSERRPTTHEAGGTKTATLRFENPSHLAAGDLVLNPGTALHQVTPVTRGARIASFFWVESMVASLERNRLANPS